MNETQVTVIGNVVAEPAMRLTPQGVPLARFRLASTARRFDQRAGQWRDGDSIYLGVTCWRSLAENVTASLGRGDGVIVTGRLLMRQYEGSDGQQRTVYEVDASAVGPDLARHVARLAKVTRTVQVAGAAGDRAAGDGNAPEEAAEGPAEESAARTEAGEESAARTEAGEESAGRAEAAASAA